MKFPNFLIFLIGFCSANFNSMNNEERQCGSNITNLWVDVVLLVDVSSGMEQTELDTIASNINSVFSSSRIGSWPYEPRTTRVGLGTYSYDGFTVADLNQFNSTSDLDVTVKRTLSTTSSSSESDLNMGLFSAWIDLTSDPYNSTRHHYRKVIVVYTAFCPSGRDSGSSRAADIKQRGGTIITMGFDRNNDSSFRECLAEIASPGLSFTYTYENPDEARKEVQKGLTLANCFCPADYYQFNYVTPSGTVSNLGTCVFPAPENGTWRGAQLFCRNFFQNGYLATEFSQAKHEFNMWIASFYLDPPFQYHIGLNMVKGVWQWEQPVGLPNPPLQNWTNWDGGIQPISSTATAVMNIQKGDDIVWKNIPSLNTLANYMCECYACDTDNYCAVVDQT